MSQLLNILLHLNLEPMIMICPRYREEDLAPFSQEIHKLCTKTL